MFNGEGVPQDKMEAVDLFRKAAEQGLVEAQRDLANIFKDNGNREEALIWFRRAAEQESLESKYDLALTLLDKGTPEERQEAVLLLTELAEKDYKDAQQQLKKFKRKRVQFSYKCRDTFRAFIGR